VEELTTMIGAISTMINDLSERSSSSDSSELTYDIGSANSELADLKEYSTMLKRRLANVKRHLRSDAAKKAKQNDEEARARAKLQLEEAIKAFKSVCHDLHQTDDDSRSVDVDEFDSKMQPVMKQLRDARACMAAFEEPQHASGLTAAVQRIAAKLNVIGATRYEIRFHLRSLMQECIQTGRRLQTDYQAAQEVVSSFPSTSRLESNSEWKTAFADEAAKYEAHKASVRQLESYNAMLMEYSEDKDKKHAGKHAADDADVADDK
jgi:hypothetical protein